MRLLKRRKSSETFLSSKKTSAAPMDDFKEGFSKRSYPSCHVFCDLVFS